MKKFKNKKLIIGLLGVILIILILMLVLGFNKDHGKSEDAVKFKDEYESLNGLVNEKSGKDYRSIEIAKDNPFIYKNADEIVEMIENKETFVVYFGFDSCPWCRSVVPTLIEVAKDMEISRIYYVDVKEIRDVIEVNESNELEKTTEGSAGYYKLIDLLSDVLKDYNINDSDGNLVSTNEKRIYAPNLVSVIKGKADTLVTGISDKQTDGYMELTEEMKNDTYNIFYEGLKNIESSFHTCDESC